MNANVITVIISGYPSKLTSKVYYLNAKHLFHYLAKSVLFYIFRFNLHEIARIQFKLYAVYLKPCIFGYIVLTLYF